MFALSLGILSVLALFSMERYLEYVQYTEDVEKTYRVINAVTTLETLLKDAETDNRGYLLTQDSSFLEPLLHSQAGIKKVYAQVRVLTGESQHQQQRAAYLNILIQDMLDAMRHTRLMYLHNSEAYSNNLRLSKKKMDECREMLGEMKQEELDVLKHRRASKYFYEARAPEFMTGLFAFTAITFTICFVIIVRELRTTRKYQKELEHRLLELHQFNAELEQIAYISSHDLQEPLRKISTFTDRLIMKHSPNLTEEGKQVLSRLSKASLRMRGLVEDLANYTSLVQVNATKQPVNLTEVVTSAAKELELTSPEKMVQLFCDHLPVIKGFKDQLQLLFKALIDNSIKFSKPGVMPRVHVYGNPATQDDLNAFNLPASTSYIKVTLRDNGIGFENEFAEKMFKLFQRLHAQASGYEGKGIGLAIVKRVMANHNGLVFAKGFVMNGAEFILFFPQG